MVWKPDQSLLQANPRLLWRWYLPSGHRYGSDRNDGESQLCSVRMNFTFASYLDMKNTSKSFIDAEYELYINPFCILFHCCRTGDVIWVGSDDIWFVSLQGSWLPEINTRGTSDQHSRPVSRCTCYDRHVHRCQSQLQAPTATRGGNHPVDSVTAATWIQRRSPRRCMKKPVHRFESELLAAAADDRDVRILLNGDRIHLDWFCHLSVWVWSS